MKRIKYKRVDNLMISRKPVKSQTTDANYIVRINLDDMTYKIVNTSNGHVVKISNRKITHFNALLRSVRNKLRTLGCNVIKEVRDRDYGRCEKGQYANAKA